MKNNDIYIFDESSPLLETRRNILFHDNRAWGTEIPTYLVELPNTSPDTPAPPSKLLETPRRSRGPSIVNTNFQPSPTRREEDEAFQSIVSSNYRQSIKIEDNDEINKILQSKGGSNEIEFETVEPIKVDLESKESSNLKNETGSPQTLTIEEESSKNSTKDSFSSPNKGVIKPPPVAPLKNRSGKSKVMRQKNNSFEPGSGALKNVSDSAHSRVLQKSPFTNENSDSRDKKASRLKIMLMLVPSDSDSDIDNSYDGLHKRELKLNSTRLERDNFKKDRCRRTSVADSRQDKSPISARNTGKSAHRPESKVVKFSVDDELMISDHKKNSHKYKARRKQTPYMTDVNPFQIYHAEDQSPSRSVLSNNDKNNRKRSDLRQRAQKQKEAVDRPDKAKTVTKTIVTTRRYHVQLLEQESDNWFNSCISIADDNKADMKYEGTVKITLLTQNNETR